MKSSCSIYDIQPDGSVLSNPVFLNIIGQFCQNILAGISQICQSFCVLSPLNNLQTAGRTANTVFVENNREII